MLSLPVHRHVGQVECECWLYITLLFVHTHQRSHHTLQPAGVDVRICAKVRTLCFLPLGSLCGLSDFQCSVTHVSILKGSTFVRITTVYWLDTLMCYNSLSKSFFLLWTAHASALCCMCGPYSEKHLQWIHNMVDGHKLLHVKYLISSCVITGIRSFLVDLWFFCWKY